MLWELDQEFDDKSFERLCTDLMHRWGFTRIVPLGGNYDLARDAEADASDMATVGERVVFQFSLEKKWEAKLRRELKRVRQHGHTINKFVFVTSQKVTGQARDKLKREVLHEFGWGLEIFDREWLRLQLEVAHPDLATHYLRVPEKPTQERLRPLVHVDLPEGYEPLRALLRAGRFDEAIPVIKAQIGTGERAELWEALAWSYYMTYNYKEALRCIERALTLGPASMQTLSIKGSILAEDGIESHSRIKLIQARTIFENLITQQDHPIAHYNLANVLVELDEPEKARDHYLEATKSNSALAEVWKNLGSCYQRLNQHDKALECLDRALAINPHLVQALAAKGMTLCKVYRRWEEGLPLIDLAIEKEGGLSRWPYIYWWKAHFLVELGRHDEAVGAVEKGLSIASDDLWLLDLKARLLAKCWKLDSRFVEQAEAFFSLRTTADDDDFASWFELALIARSKGNEHDARDRLGRALGAICGLTRNFQANDLEGAAPIEDLIEFYRYLGAYVQFRKVFPLESYVEPGPDAATVASSLWLTFGLAVREADRIAASGTVSAVDERTRMEHAATVKRLTERAIVCASRIVAQNFKDASTEQKIAIVSRLAVLPYMCAVQEWSASFGWSLRHLELEGEAVYKSLSQHIEQEDPNVWISDMLQQVLEAANQQLGLFPQGQRQ